jgi:hypothetical protein
VGLRRAGHMHHLGVGRAHAHQPVLAFGRQITVTDLTTGEVLSTHLIQPDKSYWRNQRKKPGRWPNPPQK